MGSGRQTAPLSYAPDDWNQRARGQLADARLLVVTDLGLVVKRSVDGSQDVFVQSIATGAPVAGATVEIIGRNGLPVLTRDHATRDGHVRFPDLKSFQRERAPVLYLARRGGDSSFLPLDGRGRSLDLSRFDVGGVESNADRARARRVPVLRSRHLSARRGDSRGCDRSQPGLESATSTGLPLRLEITDPRGTVIRRETFMPGAAGFGEILHADEGELADRHVHARRCRSCADQYDADLIGSTTVQVRDFQPDRLRMKAGFSAAIGRRLGAHRRSRRRTCTWRICSARRRRIDASPRS